MRRRCRCELRCICIIIGSQEWGPAVQAMGDLQHLFSQPHCLCVRYLVKGLQL